MKRNRVVMTVKGTKYHRASSEFAAGRLREGSELCLVQEPSNPHDRHAVQVTLRYSGAALGHVSRHCSKKYFHLIEKKAIRSSQISRVERRPNGSLNIEMAIEFDEEVRDSVSHSYSWHKTLARESAVYEIVNRASGCRYVGSAADVKDRALTHERDLVNRRHHNHRLQSDFNVYGADGFSFIVARAVPVSDLLRVEDQTILLHRADGHALYNLTSDGQGAARSYASHPAQRAPASAPPRPPDSKHMSPATKVWLAIAVLFLLLLLNK